MKSTAGILLCLLAAACSKPADVGCREDDRYIVPFGNEDLTFYVGPYQEHTTTTTAAIGWETVAPGDTRLEYGPDDSYGQEVQSDSGTMHQVQIAGLQPATLYHYRACTGEQCTGDLVFSTAPEEDRPIRIAIYGDCQDNPPAHRKVIGQVMGDQANMALVVGDTVSDGRNREEFKERYYDPARALAHSIPRWAAIGNHDRKDVEAVHYIDYHIFPEDPDVPQAETSFSFTYGDAFFLVFDNTMDHFDLFFPPVEGNNPPLWLWLQEQAASEAAQSARWRFAFAHYPAISSCYNGDDNETLPEAAMRTHVLPMLWDNNFQAYFSGHVHCYERLDIDGHLVIITGGGGGGLEDPCIGDVPESQFSNCVHHHTLVELGCAQARVWARDFDGNILDQVVLHEDGSYQVAP
ncbi:MAG TPA: metallophosphoesterase [Myxococcota bacterium]|nr:metallophosphoesterase [Myxococcota bacterium]